MKRVSRNIAHSKHDIFISSEARACMQPIQPKPQRMTISLEYREGIRRQGIGQNMEATMPWLPTREHSW